MTKEREALKLALEALETLDCGDTYKTHNAASALRKALAQPEQEPVACPYCKNSATLGAVYYDQNCVGCVKRMTTPPAQQEPVVWMYQDKSTHEVRFQKHMRGFVDHGATYETPLYTTPPQRKPLTDDEIHAIYDEVARREPYNMAVTRRNIARAIEAAHGIKEKNT